MKLRRLGIVVGVLVLMIFAGSVVADLIPGAKEDTLPFPSYGLGKTIVRVYTDYFCPPCRAAEPDLEPLLMDLMKSKKITVVFVDTPIYPDSRFYALRFLYALNKQNDFEHAMRVRSILFEAAAKKTAQSALDGLLKDKGMLLTPFEAKPVLMKLNDLLKADKVTSTPTVVIAKDGKTDKLLGGPEILKALKELQ